MSNAAIDVSKQFSPTPAGRFLTDGPYSGEAFREKLLYPALSANNKVVVNLDGALGYGSSFLEEAFGGLVREKGLKLDDLKQKLEIKSSRKFYSDRIWHYIREADKKLK
jgi:hypothetical protein